MNGKECRGQFRVRLSQVVPIDDRTFNAVAKISKSGTPFPTTVRTYQDVELAKYVHNMSIRVGNKAVVRSKYLDISGGRLRIFFVPFYAYNFNDWVQNLAKETDDVKDTKFRKTFKSIVRALDLLQEHHVYNIGVKNCIRIDDDDNVQIVLDSKKSESMVDGLPQDIEAFKNLVDEVFVKASLTNGVGHDFFKRLHIHLSNRTDINDENGSLRSYYYFLLHNPLFYEVEDRCYCILKLKMFRDMDVAALDGKIAPISIKEIANWGPRLKPNQMLDNVYNFDLKKYTTEASILLFYYNCYEHATGKGGVIIEVQKELDCCFPEAIYSLFYFFVERIEVHKMFRNFQVLEYFRVVSPSPNFLK